MKTIVKISQPKKSASVFKIRCLFCTVVSSFICGAAGLVSIVLAIFVFIICCASGIYLVCFYCDLKVLNTNFYLLDDKLLIEKGVHIKKKTYIKFSCVEHTSKVSFPEQRIFNLSGLVLHLKGSKVYLENFDEQNLNLIVEKIKACQE